MVLTAHMRSVRCRGKLQQELRQTSDSLIHINWLVSPIFGIFLDGNTDMRAPFSSDSQLTYSHINRRNEFYAMAQYVLWAALAISALSHFVLSLLCSSPANDAKCSTKWYICQQWRQNIHAMVKWLNSNALISSNSNKRNNGRSFFLFCSRRANKLPIWPLFCSALIGNGFVLNFSLFHGVDRSKL